MGCSEEEDIVSSWEVNERRESEKGKMTNGVWAPPTSFGFDSFKSSRIYQHLVE